MNKVKVTPDLQRVIVLPDPAPDKIGSILVPDTSKKDKPGKGTIVVSGLGEADRPMRYFPGDRIVYSLYSGTEVELNLDGKEKTYLIMNQMDIWLKMEDAE